MTDLLREAAERLRAAGIESPRAEARLFWEHAEKQKLSLSLTGGEGWGEGAQIQRLTGTPPHPDALPQGGRGNSLFEDLLQRRLRHEPLAYITGHKEFWSLDFEVGPGVLIPRPETETLIEVALTEVPERDKAYRVLDLGIGSGCLLISFLSERPNATGVGIDSSDAALRWARRNVARHGFEDRIELIEAGWEAADGSFDVILSNPPYIPTGELGGLSPDVRDYEPQAALDGGPDGLSAYRGIAPILKRHLKPKGWALLEIGAGQHQMVERIMAAQGLQVARIVPDLAGIPRCLVVRP